MAKSSAVAAGNTAAATQYNNLRLDALGASALLPSAQSSPNMTVLVQSGTVYAGTTRVVYAGGSSGSFTAPISNPRIDLLYLNAAGALTILQGTEAASPTAPTTPDGVIPICHVYLRVSTTALYDTDQGSNGYVLRDIRPVIGVPPAATLPTTQVFTASGTYTKPAGLKYAIVEVQGAGGTGGTSTSGTSGGGGGGGGYVRKAIAAASIAATETVTIGAAGAGSGNTSFGALVVAGNGGNASAGTAGTAGAASGGDLNIAGSAGAAGSTASASGNLNAGEGGSSQFGSGGQGAATGPSTIEGFAGFDGKGYGAGGGGGVSATDGSPTAAGGAGVAGLIVVTEFY